MKGCCACELKGDFEIFSLGKEFSDITVTLVHTALELPHADMSVKRRVLLLFSLLKERTS